ncbi:MAG: hypothetical protein RR253_02075 [Oscillospiraceae bacterium]
MMLKLMFTLEGLYSRLPKYVQYFSIKLVGKKYYIYANYSLGRKSIIGRYDDIQVANEQLRQILKIQKQ